MSDISKNNSYKTDILIVGCGPVGIFASYQAGFLGMKTIIVDALEEKGGQLNALYPYKDIYDIPGYPKILAKDLISNLLEQAGQFNDIHLMNRLVTSLEKNKDNSFTVQTSKGDIITAKAIIISAGAGAFGPNRPPIQNIESYEGKSVFYAVKNPEDFRNKTIVIVGGGDSAVDWAVGLESIAKKIYVVHRRDSFRAVESTVAKMRELADNGSGKVEMVIPYQLASIHGSNNILDTVIVKTLKGDTKEIKADCLLAFFGLARSLGELESWGFNINTINSSIGVNPAGFESKIPGIFAVGDVADYEHKVRLISVGFGEAANAVHYAWKYVFPDKVFHFVHSTAK